MRFPTGFVQNSDDDLDCNDLDEHGWCEADHPGMLLVLEYSNDRWTNLGRLLAGKSFQYASGLSFQNQLMMIGGNRDGNVFGWSQIFDEDTGDTQVLQDMTFV